MSQRKLLTRQEARILALVTLTDKEASNKLHISMHTLRWHWRHIARKLGVQTRTAAAFMLGHSRAQLGDPITSGGYTERLSEEQS